MFALRVLPARPDSIDIANSSTIIDRVFVSTDDSEIADIARGSGAEIILRPNDLATDDSSEWLAWRHAIKYVKEIYGDFDNFISIPTTSPLRSLKDVESAISKRAKDNADICISVVESSRSPFFNMVKKSGSGYFELVNKPECSVERRQDAPKVYDITTVVYVVSPNFILNSYGLFSGNVTSIEVPKERGIDIDDIYDFLLAEAILKKREANDA